MTQHHYTVVMVCHPPHSLQLQPQPRLHTCETNLPRAMKKFTILMVSFKICNRTFKPKCYILNGYSHDLCKDKISHKLYWLFMLIKRIKAKFWSHPFGTSFGLAELWVINRFLFSNWFYFSNNIQNTKRHRTLYNNVEKVCVFKCIIIYNVIHHCNEVDAVKAPIRPNPMHGGGSGGGGEGGILYKYGDWVPTILPNEIIPNTSNINIKTNPK